MIYRALGIAVGLMVSVSAAFGADLDSSTPREIAHLLNFISASPCQFNRNGSWYKASEAAGHIERKYRVVLAQGLIGKTEDFIRYAAAESSLSGRSYQVKCGGAPEITSAEWLTRELASYRSRSK